MRPPLSELRPAGAPDLPAEAGEGQEYEGTRGGALAWVRRLPVGAVALLPGLITLGLCAYQLSRPNALFGIIAFDDGIYLGAAVRFVHGTIPYRDFTFVQGPGMILLTTPLGLLSRIVGTRDALALARILTAAVASANAVLAGLALSHRGRLAVLAAGGALALFPLAVVADDTLLTEPYLVLFCLLGTLAVCAGGRLAGERRLLLGGLAFGFAGTVKLFAIIPIVAMLACCIRRPRDAALPFAKGAALGFLVPSLPFICLAPVAFLKDVFYVQFPHGGPITTPNAGSRMLTLTGLGGLPNLGASTGEAAVAMLSLLALAVALVVVRRRAARLADWFMLVTALLAVAALLGPKNFYPHYAYFSAACLALMIGSVTGLLATAPLPGRVALARLPGRARASLAISALLAIATVGALVLQQDGAFAASDLATADVPSGASSTIDPGPSLEDEIPPGACVVFDTPMLALTANRYVADSACPPIVDPFSIWLTDDDGHQPPTSPPYPAAFVGEWQRWFSEAEYVLLWVPGSDFVPFDPTLSAWFAVHYRLVASRPGAYLYAHRAGSFTP